MTRLLDEARAAFEQRRWTRCHDVYLEVESPLDVDDLERLALASQLIGEDDLAASTWERTHLMLLESGDLERAVRCAFWLAFGLMNRGQMAQAGGWIGRAQRLVDEHELDCAERGFLLVPVGLRTLEGGDPAAAREIFERVLALGHRFREDDLIALGRLGQGRCLVVMGQHEEGLALLDEAMVKVTAEEVTPLVAGRIYCAVILVCQQAFDLRRAHEWTAALSAWCESQPDIVPFRGQCLVHRSEVLQWRGDWSGAIDEARRARDRLADPPGQPVIGMAFYQLGELYRLRGEAADAEAAYREASRHGRTPQPGLALLRLQEGDASAAESAARHFFDGPVDRTGRAQLLAATVEILLHVEDADGAAAAADELSTIAREVGAPVLQAMALDATGAVTLRRGDARSALGAARRAAEAWADLEAPYELARSRVLVAQAATQLGDGDTAKLEADAAREVFADLGASPDRRRVDELFPSGRKDTDILTERQVEVLSLVAAGWTNREIASELYVSEHTVRRHLQNIFTRIDVGSRAAATAWAYEHELV